MFSDAISSKPKLIHTYDLQIVKTVWRIKVNNEKKLIIALLVGNTNVQYYVTNDKLFCIIFDCDAKIGQGGRIRMLENVQVKYKNIIYDVVM